MEKDGGMKLKNSRRTCPSATFSITNPTWIHPGANPGLRVKAGE
jgi:hypothetical protein